MQGYPVFRSVLAIEIPRERCPSLSPHIPKWRCPPGALEYTQRTLRPRSRAYLLMVVAVVAAVADVTAAALFLHTHKTSVPTRTYRFVH